MSEPWGVETQPPTTHTYTYTSQTHWNGPTGLCLLLGVGVGLTMLFFLTNIQYYSEMNATGKALESSDLVRPLT